MRLLSVRLIVSLILGITLVSAGFFLLRSAGQKRALRSDLEHRDEMLGESLVGNVERSWNSGSSGPTLSEQLVPDNELLQLVQRFGDREHLLGVVVFNRQGNVVDITPGLAKTLSVNSPPFQQAITQEREESWFVRL